MKPLFTDNGRRAAGAIDSFAHRLAIPAQRLAAALAIALVSHGADIHAGAGQLRVPQPLVVQNCDDSGPDSLRDVIQNQAQSGDLVDLSQVPQPCVITLTSGEIPVAQDSLILRGPAEGSVTISGDHASRIFHHTGNGTLTLDSLSIVDGEDQSNGDASGGCILSYAGGVNLDHSIVSGCKAVSDTGYAFGGAISAAGTVTLTRSSVSNNEARAATKSATGGGVFTSGTVSATYSIVQGNSASDGPGSTGLGGGIAALSGAALTASTLAGNSGYYGAALFAGLGAVIGDSTISGNTSRGVDVVRVIGNVQSVIANSTIAENHVDGTTHAGAVYFDGGSPLIVKSSILGTNTAGAGHVPADLYTTSGTLDPSGHDNLIVASNVAAAAPGVITVTTDPKLGPLQWNGGPTPTHQLM
ncbi:MAG: hypothetical protein ABW186_00010, partial [Rhodanobacteraceae bacterium]